MCTELYLISKEGNLFSIRNNDEFKTLGARMSKVKKSSDNPYSYLNYYLYGDEKFLSDGMNSEGLMINGLWLGDSKYSKEPQKLQLLDMPKMILGHCSTVEEVCQKFDGVSLSATPETIFDGITEVIYPTVHYSIHDKNNKSIIVEFHNGKITIHENKYQVMTNDPFYEWHLRNVQNYLSLTNEMLPFDLYKECAPVYGSRLVGLPGDFTSHSRFIKVQRLVSFVKRNTYSDKETVALLDRIIRNVTVPRTSKYVGGDRYDMTQYTVIKDRKNKTFYIRNIDSLKYDEIYTLDV